MWGATSTLSFGQFRVEKNDQASIPAAHLNQNKIYYSIGLGDQESRLYRCAINLKIGEIDEVDIVATASDYIVQFSVPVEKNENHLVRMKGKIKWGIPPNNAPACSVDGEISINQIILNEWQPIKDKFRDSDSLRCINFGFSKFDRTINEPVAADKLLPRPTDTISKRIFDVCDELLAKPLRNNLSCNLTGVSEKTFCNEVYYSPSNVNRILNLQEAVNAALDGQQVIKGLVETASAQSSRLAAQVEKKKQEEENQKKKLEQRIIANKVEEFLFNKKWSNDDVSCNFQGGDYVVYTNKGPSGIQLFLVGKKMPDSSQGQSFYFNVIDEKTVDYVHEIHASGNNFMMKLVRNPFIVVGRIEHRITIVSPTRLEYTRIDRMIDLDKLIKSGGRVIRYEIRKNSGFRKLCK